jgi:peptidoglycan/LPS O-acetylase OafA/YrhL
VNSKQYNTDIQCLRAVAVLCVAFHHMQGNLFHPGLVPLQRFLQHAGYWFGVDLFFAISGYVIGRSLLPQMIAQRRSARDLLNMVTAFWIRRAWRLLPSAWLWLAVILGAVIFANQSGAFGSLHANVMASLAGLFNVANFRFADAFFRYEYGASFIYWSLSLEEQFYLLLPLLVLCLRRRIDVFMIALFVIQLFLYRTPLLMSLRTDALALGVLLSMAESSSAYAKANPRFLLRLGPMRWIAPVLLLALLSVLASPELQAWRWRISAIAVVSALLVWLASYDSDYLLANGHLKQMLTWIGSRSYAIYIIHIPVYFLLREAEFRLGFVASTMSPLHAVTLAAIAVTLTLWLCDLNYRLVEQPLRRRGQSVADRYLNRRGTIGQKPAGGPSGFMLPDAAKSAS